MSMHESCAKMGSQVFNIMRALSAVNAKMLEDKIKTALQPGGRQIDWDKDLNGLSHKDIREYTKLAVEMQRYGLGEADGRGQAVPQEASKPEVPADRDDVYFRRGQGGGIR